MKTYSVGLLIRWFCWHSMVSYDFCSVHCVISCLFLLFQLSFSLFLLNCRLYIFFAVLFLTSRLPVRSLSIVTALNAASLFLSFYFVSPLFCKLLFVVCVLRYAHFLMKSSSITRYNFTLWPVADKYFHAFIGFNVTLQIRLMRHVDMFHFL